MQSRIDGGPITVVLHLFFMGGLEVIGPDGKKIPIKNRKARGILACLALSPNFSRSREHLVGMLWADSPETQARASLRQTLKSLRTVFEEIGFTGLNSERQEISIDRDSITIDLTTISRNLESGIVSQTLFGRNGQPEKILYGYEDLGQPFSEWLTILRGEYEQNFVSSLQSILQNSDLENERKATQALANIDPANEAIQRNLILQYFNLGNLQKALQQYNVLELILDRDFDMLPERATQDLIEKIRAGILSPKVKQGLENSEKSDETIASDNSLVAAVVCLKHADGFEEIAKLRSGKILQRRDGISIIRFESPSAAIDFASSIHTGGSVDQKSDNSSIRLSVNLIAAYPDDAVGFCDNMDISFGLLKHAAEGESITTANVHNLYPDNIDLQSEDLGFVNLSSIAQRVRIYRIFSDRFDDTASKNTQDYLPSIAVMPFRQRNVGRQSNEMSDGMVHEIVTLLASLREVFVVSNTSTFSLHDFDMDIPTAARKLGVQFILTGFVTVSDKLLNVVVELTDTDTGQIIWADRYGFMYHDILEIEAEIASKVAFALLPHIHIAELKRGARKPPNSLDAHENLIRGINQLYRLTSESFSSSLEYFTKAILIDGNYASAYAYRAKWGILQIGEGRALDVKATSIESLDFARKALDLDPMDPLALSVFGHVQSFMFRNYDSAVNAFEKALLASPNSATAWGLSAPTYFYLGQSEEAVRRAERALNISPLEPYTYFYTGILVAAYYSNGDFEEAIYWGRKTLATSPWFVANMRPLIASLVALGNQSEAEEIASALLDVDPSFRVGPFCEWYPIKDKKELEQFAAHLLAAGLPN